MRRQQRRKCEHGKQSDRHSAGRGTCVLARTNTAGTAAIGAFRHRHVLRRVAHQPARQGPRGFHHAPCSSDRLLATPCPRRSSVVGASSSGPTEEVTKGCKKPQPSQSSGLVYIFEKRSGLSRHPRIDALERIRNPSSPCEIFLRRGAVYRHILG